MANKTIEITIDKESGTITIKYLTADFGECAGGTKTFDGPYTIRTFTSNETLVLPEKTAPFPSFLP